MLFLALFHVNVESSCLVLCAFVSFLHVLHILHQDTVNHKHTNNRKQSVPEQRFARGWPGTWGIPAVLCSCECGMQLYCGVRFQVFVACATRFAVRRSKPQTDKQLQTKRARTEVCAGAGTWGIPAASSTTNKACQNRGLRGAWDMGHPCCRVFL